MVIVSFLSLAKYSLYELKCIDSIFLHVGGRIHVFICMCTVPSSPTTPKKYGSPKSHGVIRTQIVAITTKNSPNSVGARKSLLTI